MIANRRRHAADFRRLQLTRRDTLRAGVLSLTGPGLAGSAAGEAGRRNSGPNGFGRAKSCILIFMWGGPSQLDTWDPKPDAPEDDSRTVRPSRRACRGSRSASTSRCWPGKRTGCRSSGR